MTRAVTIPSARRMRSEPAAAPHVPTLLRSSVGIGSPQAKILPSPYSKNDWPHPEPDCTFLDAQANVRLTLGLFSDFHKTKTVTATA